MKKLLILTLLGMFILSSVVMAEGIIQVDRSNEAPSFLGYAPNKLIVKFKDDAGRMRFSMAANAVVHIGEPAFDAISDKYAVSRISKQFAGSDVKAPQLAGYHKIYFEAGELTDIMAEYAAHPMVEKVEPVGIHRMWATPNDTYFSPYQWYHEQTNDDDIDATAGWDIQTGNSNIILAILDSGTRYYHPDLGGVNASPTNVGASRGNMWINTAELNGSAGVDDDGNGYIDDWIGYDFIDGVTNCWPGEDCNTKDNDPRDFNGHGTHTAGIVGMITNDGYGMAGVAGGWGNGSQAEFGNGVKVMALRMGYSYDHFLYGEVGVVMMDAAAEAFYYAADNGARIASCSWGSSNSGGIAAAADYFIANGGLIFVAAGNDGSQTASYLASRGDCIDVAATDTTDAAADFTTYGTWVDISAPGTGIYSTYHDHTDAPTNYWAALDGTSMACPMAAGVGAMIWSQNPTWTAAQVEAQLYSSADNIDAELSATYIGKMGAGRINLFNAVNTGPIPPTAEFSGSPTSGTEPLTVNFTDLSTGTIDTWSWTFGDGGSSSAQNPSYTYNTPGTYDVSLTVSGAAGSDSQTKVGYITVNACVAPVADFSGSPISGNEPLSVSFTDLSTNSPTSWSWTFGDGGSSTAQNPSYTYNTAGTYTVSLTATNSCGSDVATKIDYITVDPPLPAQNTYANADISVLGTYTGSYLNTYSSDNSYEVITESESTTHPRKVTSNAEHKWTFDLGSGGNNMMFYLEGYRPNNSDGDDFVFTYSVDDITYNSLFTVASATEQVYSVAIPAGLSGTVYVRMVDNNRSWDLISLDAMYIDEMYFSFETGPVAPTADFVGTPTSGNTPLNVSFTDLSTGSPTSWSWTFGDGGTSTVQSPSYTYNTAGTYTVSLTVSNANGSDTQTKTNYITVTEPGNDFSHVANMVVGRTRAGSNYKGNCEVTVYDQTNAPLANATVFVSYDGPNSGTLNGVTAADGTVFFESPPFKKPTVEWCFEVTNITHATHTYDAASNAMTRVCESGVVFSNGVSDMLSLPTVFGLSQNYPNPFNPTTSISFSLPQADQVSLEVYNMLGQRLAVLANGQFAAGYHTVEWDASDNASGIYLYRLVTTNETVTKKMLLMK